MALRAISTLPSNHSGSASRSRRYRTISVRSARGGLRNSPNSSTTVAAGASAPFALDLPRGLAAVDEVEDADDLVGRQPAEQGQPDVPVPLEGAQDQRDDEHLLVVADVAMVVIPGGQPDIEPRVQLDQIAMDRPDLAQLAVGRGQQRVEDIQPQVLLEGHDPLLLIRASHPRHVRPGGGRAPGPRRAGPRQRCVRSCHWVRASPSPRIGHPGGTRSRECTSAPCCRPIQVASALIPSTAMHIGQLSSCNPTVGPTRSEPVQVA